MAGRGRGQGSGQGKSERIAKAKGAKPNRRGEEGDPSSNEASGKAAKRTKLDQTDAADLNLRDATPDERDAWGRINDRDVARSLQELWDKIPPSYRLMVTQYFKELSDPEPEKPAK